MQIKTLIFKPMRIIYLFLFIILLFSCSSTDDEPPVVKDILQLASVKYGTMPLSQSNTIGELPLDKGIVADFNLPLDRPSAESNLSIQDKDGNDISLNFNYLNNDRTIVATPLTTLVPSMTYTLSIGEIKAASGEVFPGAIYLFSTAGINFNLASIQIDGENLTPSQKRIQNISEDFNIEARFSSPLDPSTAFADFITVKDNTSSLNLQYTLSEDQQTLLISPAGTIKYLRKYTFNISPALKGADGASFAGFTNTFYTAVDSTYKFPAITDEALLTLVQEQTFKYFWDFAHPASGMARERNSSGDLVTSGGSGFGVMAILVGIERGFITRQQGIDRLEKIVGFLQTADRFHGVWPHWMNGNTGRVIAFSAQDNGGDLIETSFMIQGLLAVRQYLDTAVPQEAALSNTITQLWEEVEWDWYTKGGGNVLYWHWSPNFEWAINLPIRGWNEGLVTYVLAASSPTHPIDASVYHQGWARNGGMANGKSFYDINLPLGEDFGGPLFFAHYSFLGLDPRNLQDQYANYWTQNVNHTRINHQYVVSNPRQFVGYGAASWGLTASDNQLGYSAHSPTNDLGVITPTAALSSFPYTPEISMDALKYFYYILGDKMWGPYGFRDAYNPTENWYANSYLAIDQGPIVIMIENHRSGLLWDFFMADPEITKGLQKLGFSGY